MESENHRVSPHEALERLCVFCEILKGNEESSIIVSEGKATAFMDKFGNYPLVVPNNHFSELTIENEKDFLAMERLALRLSKVIRQLYPEYGVRLLQNMDLAAGQEIPHPHTHVMTVKQGMRRQTSQEPFPRNVLDERANEIRNAYQSMYPVQK